MTEFQLTHKWLDVEDGKISVLFEENNMELRNLPNYLLEDPEFVDSMAQIQMNIFNTIDEYIISKMTKNDYLEI